jgi:hypothetical protein
MGLVLKIVFSIAGYKEGLIPLSSVEITKQTPLVSSFLIIK